MAKKQVVPSGKPTRQINTGPMTVTRGLTSVPAPQFIKVTIGLEKKMETIEDYMQEYMIQLTNTLDQIQDLRTKGFQRPMEDLSNYMDVDYSPGMDYNDKLVDSVLMPLKIIKNVITELDNLNLGRLIERIESLKKMKRVLDHSNKDGIIVED